ncbi:MAG TPA: hypothetical protein VJX30_16720 [Terriglobales bacterium]|nr:hypothetical protein [Terriglobales bacterium]
MKKLFFAGLLTLLLMPVLAMAQHPFDGTWKADMSTLTKPNVYVLQKGMFECKTCTPPVNIKADGTDQKVTGYSDRDTTSAKAIDDHNVEITDKKDGRVVGTTKFSVSSDGDTLTVNWTYSGNPSGGTQTGSSTAKRVAKGPADANLITGSWRDTSPAIRTWTFKVNGDELTMTTPTGQSYTAKLDGTDAPYKGAPGVTSVSVKMRGKDTLEEIDKRDGKVTEIDQMTVSADGKTMKWVSENKLQKHTIKFDAQKQ